MNTNSNEKQINIIIFFLTFISILSQIPDLIGNSGYRSFYFAAWVITFLYLLFNSNGKTAFIGVVIVYIVFDLLLLFFSVFNSNSYLNSSIFSVVHLCLFVLYVGYSFGINSNNGSLLIWLSYGVYWGTLVVAISIYFSYFRGVDFANTKGFLYISKNSAATLLITALIAERYVISGNYIGKRIRWILFAVIDVFYVYLIFILKSRANIVCLFVLVVMYYFIKAKRIYQKIIMFLIIGIIVLIVLNNSELKSILIDNIFLNNKSIDDTYGVTGGRNYHLEVFEKYFPDAIWAGYGGWYLESFPLTTLLSYGIIGAIPVFLISFYPLYFCRKFKDTIKSDNNLKKLSQMVITINIVYWVNGIFEEQSPFGPGIKCFYLWLCTGILVAWVFRRIRNTDGQLLIENDAMG